MTYSETPLIQRMESLIAQWRGAGDQRYVFLACYQMMTGNVLAALEKGQFQHAGWVNQLLHVFADYYFTALASYEADPGKAPLVWQAAHGAARDKHKTPLHCLLLGVSAHVNYDLVLATADMLRPDWKQTGEALREARHQDFTRVSDIIAETVDPAQEQLINALMPGMGLLDRLMGPFDEFVISEMIRAWRETVWQHAVRLVETSDAEAQMRLVGEVEAEAMAFAKSLG